MPLTTVHPRLRGEHAMPLIGMMPRSGSSPPARGTPYCLGAPHRCRRFIPACAGNTSVENMPDSYRAVHPRLRGEHGVSHPPERLFRGSSPPARGTRGRRGTDRLCQRFIPACAGNTHHAGGSIQNGTVHPRLRGEHHYRQCQHGMGYGSSPPARGTLRFSAQRLGFRRFIPACAGNTAGIIAILEELRVHPRLRGEHPPRRRQHPEWNGSSPPARGTRHVWHYPLRQRRFIPACAGNTRRVRPQAGPTAVHPRLRGEHLQHTPLMQQYPGSSPPARGTLFI